MVIVKWFPPRDHCFVTNHRATLQYNQLVTLRGPLFGDSIMKSPWPLACDESPTNVNMKSHGDLLQTTNHSDFTIEPKMMVNWESSNYFILASLESRHNPFVMSPNDGHIIVFIWRIKYITFLVTFVTETAERMAVRLTCYLFFFFTFGIYVSFAWSLTGYFTYENYNIVSVS